MAASGFTPIITYHSTTASAVPTAGNLSPGELALNINDMKLYCENSSGVVTLLASAAGATGDVTAAGNNAFTGANTFYNNTGQTIGTGTSTQDGLILTGRSGGSSSYRITIQPTTLSSSTTLSLPNVTDTVATIGTAQTFTAAQTFRAANAIRSEAASTQDAIVIAGRAGGTSSYAITLTPITLSSNTTLTLPNVTDTVATIGTAQTFTAAQTFRAANAIRSEAAATQDAVVIAGRAGGTNSYAITLTPETLTGSRTFTLPEPGEDVTIGYLNIPQNSQSTAYTLVATDAGKHILHPSADTTARTFTIPANSSVPYAIGTAITFINQNGAGVVTIAINTDTMRLAGAGTTGNRTLAANGIATCVKVTSTEWIISGTGLT